MLTLTETLDGLSPDARGRVLDYVKAKYSSAHVERRTPLMSHFGGDDTERRTGDGPVG